MHTGVEADTRSNASQVPRIQQAPATRRTYQSRPCRLLLLQARLACGSCGIRVLVTQGRSQLAHTSPSDFPGAGDWALTGLESRHRPHLAVGLGLGWAFSEFCKDRKGSSIRTAFGG